MSEDRVGSESGGSHTIQVTMQREFQIPADLVDEENAEDYFWNYWGEFLAEEPPTKDDINGVEVL